MKKSVLLVDDNLDLLEALSEALAHEGMEARTAESGAAALRLLEEGYEPDLIVLDVRMPGMSGPELLDELETRQTPTGSSVPVVFASAGKPPLDHRVAGFIDKMTDLSDYVRQIENFAYFGGRKSA